MGGFMTRLIRVLARIFRWALYGAAALAVIAILTAGYLTLTPPGRANLAGIISDMASTPQSGVKVTGVSGIWSGSLRVEKVELSDRGGAWLDMTNVAVDWSPTALLSRRFDAELVSVGEIDLRRTPVAEQRASDTSSGFSLPVSIDIGRLELPQVALGAGLAGDLAQLSASGNLRVGRDPLAVDTALRIERTDGREGSIEAVMAYLPQDNRIDLDVRGSEPAGGIIAGLLQLPGDPAVEITLAGRGPASDWQGEGSFSVDGEEITTLQARHRMDDSGRVIEATGSGAFAQFVPEIVRPAIDGPTTFDVAVVLPDAGGVHVRRALVNSQAVSLAASGTIDMAGASDFSVQAEATDGPLSFVFGEEDARTRIELSGATGRIAGAGTPAVDVTLALPAVASPMAQASNVDVALHSDAFDLQSQSGPFSLDLSAARIESDNPDLAPLLQGRLAGAVSGTLAADSVTIDSADIRNDAASVKATGRVDRADGALALDIAADVLSAALPAAAQAPLGERVTISGRLDRNGQGAISLSGFEAASGGLALSGNVSLDGAEIDADVSGSLADLAALSPQATGALSFSTRATGDLGRPQFELSLNGERIESAGQAIEDFSLSASGTADPAQPAADISLSGSVDGEALRGRASLATGEQQRSVDGLEIVLGESRISGDLTLDENFMPVGSLNVSVPDLGPLAALALEEISGALTADLDFTREGDRPLLTVRASIPQFARQAVTGRDIAIEARINDYLAAPAISGRITAAGIQSGGTAIDGLNLALGQDGPWTAFNGSATVAGNPASVTGGLLMEDGRITLELDTAEATLQGVRATLGGSTVVSVQDGTARLDGLVLLVNSGRIVVSGTAGETLDLDAAITSLPLATVNSFAPGLNAAGTLNGRVTVTGPAADPSIRYNADLAGAAVSASRDAGFGAMAITSSGTFAGGRLQFDATIDDGSGLTLRGGGSVQVQGGQALGLQFSGRVPFTFLTARLAAQGLSLTGTADATISVGGTTGNPVVSGSISSTGGRFIDVRSGLAVTDLATQINIGNNVATIQSMTGTLSTGGRLSASGTVGIDAGQGFPADLNVRLDEGRYVDGRLVTATLDGALEITGPLASAPTVKGTVNLGRTVVTVPERLPGSLNALNVQHRNAPAAVVRQQEAIGPRGGGGNESSGLNLDITVNAPQQIFVQGRGIDAELGGSVRLTGPAASPRAIGQFDLRRGRLTVLAKRLSFTRGNINFSGSLTPYLDLSADSQAGTTSVTVLVRGPATDPEFTFESSPAMPQDEVLAQLVFGRSIDNLSPVQIAQLAEAAAQLAGLAGSTGLLETLRARTGLDDIDVRTDEATGESSVAVGKYLNDRTYITIERGSDAGSGKAAIDLELGRGLKLRGEAHEDGEAKGGLFFEREY